MCRVFTSSTISLLHLVPKMTCLWESHWLQKTCGRCQDRPAGEERRLTLLTLLTLAWVTGYSFNMALLSMCLSEHVLAMGKGKGISMSEGMIMGAWA